MKIPVVIVDDKRILRTALAEQLIYSNEIGVVFQACNGNDFLQKMELLKPTELPQVVLMDIEMPELDGIETVTIAKAVYPDIQFLMLTVFDNDDKIFEAIKAGASGYLLKDEKPSLIIQSVKSLVEEGSVPMSARIARKTLTMLKNQPPQEVAVADTNNGYDLSEREMQILHLIVDGLNYNQIAEKIFISPHTVRKHISNIYEKLHVSNKTAAIKIALKKNWARKEG